jgi:hypothetical protein
VNIISVALAESPTGIISAIDQFIPGGIDNIFNTGLGIGAIIALGTIIYAGVMYTTSGDSESKQKEAREWIWAAVKGLALIAIGAILINIINPNVINIQESEFEQVELIELAN